MRGASCLPFRIVHNNKGKADTVNKKKRHRSEIRHRKEKHLSICTDPLRYSVEGNSSGLEWVHFIHNALPEISEGEIDTSCQFSGYSLSLPIFISCMTGGSERGFRINRELARAAQQAKIPIGMGSFRILFDQPELFPHFYLKSLAPDVPVLANIGGVQIRDRDHREIFEWIKRLEAEILVVHLNPGQELFQPEGDRDFRGIKDALTRLCESCPVPVIAKETGFGISPSVIRELFDAGVLYVDIAGAGGTNWISAESYRRPKKERIVAEEFKAWGLPTALILAQMEDYEGRILASGGIRSGMDVAKTVALGAELAGPALPFIRSVVSGGTEAVLKYIKRIEKVLRAVMLLTGSETLKDLNRKKIWLDPYLEASVASFRRGAEGRIVGFSMNRRNR